MPVTTITDDQFAAEVLEAERTVVVDFWASWCAPCRVMDPILAELADERRDVSFVKLDVDANPRTGATYGVLSMPTLLVLRDGVDTRASSPGPRGCDPSPATATAGTALATRDPVLARSRGCGLPRDERP